MPRAEFEPAIPVFERPKTISAIDGAAIGTGLIVGFLNESLKYRHFTDNKQLNNGFKDSNWSSSK
jgi:hypothetical protein